MDALDRIKSARAAIEAATVELRQAIRAAEGDASQRAIAEAAGVSQAEVWRILRDYEDPRGTRHI